MALRNRNPSIPRQADRPDSRVVSRFFGMITGEPATKLPDYLCYKNFNTVDRGEYSNIRGGSKQYTTTYYGDLIDTTFILAANEIGIVNGTYIVGDEVWFSGDDLPAPLVENTPYYVSPYGEAGSIKYYFVFTTRAAAYTGTGYVTFTDIGSGTSYAHRGNIYGYCDHVKEGVLLFHIGTSVYVVNKTMTSYTRVLNTYFTDPPAEDSTIIPLGDNAILCCGTGMFKIFLDDSFYYMVKINLPSPDTLLADIAEISGSLTYGYLYSYSAGRISYTGNRDRVSDPENAKLKIETATNYAPGSERDYGELYFATAIGEDVTVNHIVGENTALATSGLLLKGTQARGMTHMPLYRSKNIGEESGGVSATVDGVGNRRDQLIWNADVPVCKSFIVDTSTTAGHALIVGSSNKFVRGDVGSRIRIGVVGTVGSAKITGFVSEDDVTITAYGGEVIPTSVLCFACIGGYRVFQGTQSGTTITPTPSSATDAFSLNDAGRIIFVSTGVVRHIKYVYNDGGTYKAVVAESGTLNGLAMALQADTDSGTAFNRAWNDTVPDKPQADGRVSLQDRIEYGTDLYVPRRFFRPLPDSNIGYLDSGFLVVADRDDGAYYYCQTGDKEYCIGQYKFPEQKRDVVGSIRHIGASSFNAVILGKNFTGLLSLQQSVNIGRTEIGENIYQLPELAVVDPKRGVVAWKLITYKNANLIYALTNEGAFRHFDGTSWSKEDFGFQNGLDAVSKEYLKRIDHTAAFGANYNAQGGIKLWMQRVVDGSNVDVCLRYATEAAEGRGWSILGGDDWVQPLAEIGIFTLMDANGVERVIIIDRNDFHVYEIDTFDRTTQTKKFTLDKEDVEDTEISWYKQWREEIAGIGEQEKKILQEKSYVNILPEDVGNRGESGYTDSGQRDAQELTLNAYLNGEKTTADAVTEDFPENGELVFSGQRVDADTIMFELVGTASEIRIASLRHDLLIKAAAPMRSRRNMTEHDIQEELAQDKILHICRTRNNLFNRATGVSCGTATMITGPDGRAYSGHRIAANATLDNVAIAGNYTIILWSKDANLFTGVTTFTTYGAAVGGWTMYYKQNTGLAAALILLAGDKFDIRIYDKTISAASLAKLYDNTANFEGKMLLPGF